MLRAGQPDLTQAKAIPSSRSKDRRNTGNAMSSSFVNEDENDKAELPDRPISPHPNFVTEAGLALIEAPLGRFEAARTVPQQTQATGEPPPPLCGKSVTGEYGARARKSSNLLLTKARHPLA
jgi:hypothetical protein